MESPGNNLISLYCKYIVKLWLNTTKLKLNVLLKIEDVYARERTVPLYDISFALFSLIKKGWPIPGNNLQAAPAVQVRFETPLDQSEYKATSTNYA